MMNITRKIDNSDRAILIFNSIKDPFIYLIEDKEDNSYFISFGSNSGVVTYHYEHSLPNVIFSLYERLINEQKTNSII